MCHHQVNEFNSFYWLHYESIDRFEHRDSYSSGKVVAKSVNPFAPKSSLTQPLNKFLLSRRDSNSGSAAMEGVCSAQVQAQNEHNRELKTGTVLTLQAAFADINIAKG